MRKTALLAVLLCFMSGCSWLCGDVVPKESVRAIKANTDQIFPMYLKYVEADADLHPIAKKAANTSVTETTKLIEEASK